MLEREEESKRLRLTWVPLTLQDTSGSGDPSTSQTNTFALPSVLLSFLRLLITGTPVGQIERERLQRDRQREVRAKEIIVHNYTYFLDLHVYIICLLSKLWLFSLV